MDGRRFDRVSRVLAGGADRRGVVRGLVALLLAGWGVGRPVGDSRAQDGFIDRCAVNADCRAALADDCIRAQCWRGRCSYAAIRCAAGYHCCRNGTCCEDDIAPVDPVCLSDADCASGDPCVRGACDNGMCIAMIVDCIPGYVCCGNAECCPAS